MSDKVYKVSYGVKFRTYLKSLASKYPSFLNDLSRLSYDLEKNPASQGNALGQNCYKVRMAITSKARGKSGGARVIILVQVQDGFVKLLATYDKSERENLLPGELNDLLASEKSI